ncbi:unknown [Fusobacterium sp. CAG:439]|nr:unknown [Fusobacterium sp. CAG:439]
MINQVLSVNIAQTRAFSNFSQPKNGYYINAPFNEEEKKENNHKLGKTIAISALVVGFGTLAVLSGGLNKGTAKLLNRWKLKLEQKMAKGSRFKNFYRFTAGKIDTFLAKTESINNFTTLKDVAFQRLMWGKDGSRSFTRKIHEGVTKFFDRISRKTVNSSYSNTYDKFAGLTEYFASVNEKILSRRGNDPKYANIIENINRRIATVNTNLDKGFGINARNERLKDIQKASDGLFEFFWDASLSDVRNFKSKNMWQSFIAEDYLIPAKLQLGNRAGLLRQTITHDINDNYKATIKALDNIQKFVNPSDMSTNDILNSLRNNLNKYKKLSGKEEIVQRNELNKEIITNLRKLGDNFTEMSSKYNYNSDAAKAISKYVSEVENIISKSSKGELQEILTLYKGILPRSEYLKLKAKVNSAIKSLDKSIDIETIQYFDKARDLKLGSAPTDVLSILGAVGAVGYYLNKAESKDDKYSVSLRYGIPAIGAIATSLYCTARLVSGGKAMLFGLLSGWAMNKAGVVVDDARKKYSLDVSLHNREILKPQPDKV